VVDRVFVNVDVGASAVRAVISTVDGPSFPVLVDGADSMPSGLFYDGDDRLIAGPEALVRAAAAPDLYIADPIRALGGPAMIVAGREVLPVDMWAALLRRVAGEATAVTGGPVAGVTVVVPAAWGPRRWALVRDAAHRAGLPDPMLVPSPVAVATYAAATTVIPAGALVVVCDLGAAEARASVVRRTDAHAWEVVATIADAASGGDQLDLALHQTAGLLTPAWPDPMRLAKAAALRHGSGFLADPTGAVTSVTAQAVDEASQPCLAAAAALVGRVMEAADVGADDIAVVLVAGGGAHLPSCQQVLSTAGRPVVVVARPEQAAVLGAARTPPPGADLRPVEWVAGGSPAPLLRPTLGLLTLGLASLGLLVVTATTLRIETGYILFGWSVLACACLTAVLAGLAGGGALVLGWLDKPATPGVAGRVLMPSRLILAAIAGATAAAFMYALLVAAMWNLPVGWFTPVAAKAALPAAGVGVLVAGLMVRLAHLGPRAVERLRPSALAIVVGTGGVLLYHYASNQMTGTEALAAGRVGGALIGVAGAILLLHRPGVRLLAGGVAALLAGLASTAGYDTAGWFWLACLYLWLAQTLIGVTVDAFPTLGTGTRRSHHPTRSAPAGNPSAPT
jgi:hypothetical protein